MTIGKTIVKARERLGMRQVDLARKLNVSTAVLCTWEKDEHAPRLSGIMNLATVLKIPVSALIPKGRA